MDEQTRLKARELLLRSRIYRFFALICAVVGFCVFLYLFFQHIEGGVMDSLHNPATVLILLIPFLPAVVVSWMAARTRKQFLSVLKTLMEPEDGQAASGDNSK